MSHVFGPVRSRRLGRSLGVDPLPFKTCHWNCVYCQLGRTAPLRAERRTYVPVEEIVEEVRAALVRLEGGIDWITFGGSGEPTLHADLGRMIREVKALTPTPLAVLTSGASLFREDVRSDLLAADAVLPSLDAGTERVYREVNRPWPELSFDRLVEGLVAFRRAYRGWLWVEVMLVRGLNDSDEELEHMAAILRRVEPDRVYVNVPTRPPAESWVRLPEPERLARAVAILGASAGMMASAGGHEPRPASDPRDRLLETLLRHPLAEEEMRRDLDRWAPGCAEQALSAIQDSGRVRVVTRQGRRFFAHVAGRYS
jgi:wyosine [tRNA(Phe)-imidazoG37] synthetase (radical SAM superfamily)